MTSKMCKGPTVKFVDMLLHALREESLILSPRKPIVTIYFGQVWCGPTKTIAYSVFRSLFLFPHCVCYLLAFVLDHVDFLLFLCELIH